MARFYFRGTTRVEFEPRDDVIATSTRGDARRRAPVAGSLQVPDEIAAQGVSLIATSAAAGPATAGSDALRLALERAEAEPDTEWAGAVLRVDDEGISFLTREVVLRVATEAEVADLAARHGFEVVRQLPQVRGGFVLRSQEPASYALLDRIEALVGEASVEWCEPSIVTTAQLDAVRPSQFLWPGAWDRQLVAVDHAWTLLERAGVMPFGSPDVLIAIVDQGIASDAGLAVHPDFAGVVSDGRPKLAEVFDFHRMKPDNDAIQGNHGVGVAGIATGNATRRNAGQIAPGVPGAAPNCRLMSLIFPRSEVDQLDMYLWAAGFEPGSTKPGFPEPLARGADVFSTSIGFGVGAPISQLASDTLEFIARNGRGGRGCPMFFSAGNAGSDFTTYRPWAAHAETLGVGASSLDDDGVTEVRARYSGHGPLTLCAPSHDRYPAAHNPPRAYATWSCDLPGRGDLIGHPDVTTTLSEPAHAGVRRLSVAEVAGFVEGSRLLVGRPGARGTEVATIDEVDSVTSTISVRPGLTNNHMRGAPIASGDNDYRTNFGGTSSATPLCAGVAALVLSANPELGRDDVEEILCDTAEKIDLANSDPVGQWRDATGAPTRLSGKAPVRSDWYGYGRIDAVAAVSRALAMRAVTPLGRERPVAAEA